MRGLRQLEVAAARSQREAPGKAFTLLGDVPKATCKFDFPWSGRTDPSVVVRHSRRPRDWRRPDGRGGGQGTVWRREPGGPDLRVYVAFEKRAGSNRQSCRSALGWPSEEPAGPGRHEEFDHTHLQVSRRARSPSGRGRGRKSAVYLGRRESIFAIRQSITRQLTVSMAKK
jgi:hypothetical protein